jgi:hypothetical protein
VRFAWAFQADAAPASATLDADAAGTDEGSGAALAAAAPQVAVLVQQAATLAAEFVSAPEHVNLGQSFEVRVRVSNDGDGAALGTIADVACAGCSADPAPAATTVPAWSAVEVSRSFTPIVLGTTAIGASASGVDEIDGLVRLAATVARPLSVEHPAALALVAAGAPQVPLSAFSVEVTALNPFAQPGIAQAPARGVLPGTLLVAVEPGFLGTADVSCAPDAQAATTVAAGGSASFRWSCAATRGGALKLLAEASGADANDGEPLLASTTFVLTVDEAVRVADDPFGDGTAFSFLFAYDGQVFLGPSGDGRGVVRCAPDGTGCASFSFEFWRDTTGSVSANVGCPELVTLGAQPLCDDGDPKATACFCGPDYESGRGMLGAFRLGAAGDEWLVATGRSNRRDLDYVYLTRDTASPLRFLYADLGLAFPATAENVIAMAELNGRLYLGLQVESTKGPYLVTLAATPTAPGLDATVEEAFGTSFQQTEMGNTAGMSILQVDALLGFEGRLFVANRAAVLVSRSGLPTADAATQFDECTPLAPASWRSSSIAAYPAKRDVGPADRGVTAMVAWQGRLYLARNTAAGVPELWAFTPRHDGGEFLGCAADRSDWARIATNFGTAASTHLTALFSSGRYLYAGYDSANGVELWRTASTQPLSESDFTGAGGCAFGTGGCEPVGRAGFGVAANTRFLDARALSLPGGDQVWAAVGSGSSAVQVYRLAE